MGSEAGGSDGALVVGLEVDVRSLDDSKRTQRAKIVRVHRTGDVTVQYEESGDSEKNVSADRVKVVAGGEAKSKFSIGDRVTYLASDSKKGEEDWREGTIKLSRPDGTLDVVDTESNEVVRKLPASSVRSPRGKKETTKAAKNPRQDSDISEEGAKKLAVDAAVEVKDKRGVWQAAHVLKARSDGTYDLALNNDSDDVMRKVDRQSIRSVKAKESPSKKQMKNKAEDSEEDEDDERQAIRKRKSSSRRSRKKEGSDEEEDDDDDASDARAVRPGATRVKSSQARSLGILQINSRVYYRGKDGLEYKGIVLKVWRDGGKRGEPAYDVEDLMDGTMFTKMTASKVRAMPWLDVSLPRWNGLPNLPNVFSFLNGPVLRKGVKVRFRKRDEESGRIVWTEGVIVKAKPDDSCIIDFLDQDGKKERATVKNRDIQARFFSPFSGMFDGMLDGLSLPTIDLPRTSFKVGSAVEVSNGSKVHLGTVLSYNDSAKTYSIQYSDGSKAKNVPSDSVRLSLRRLRIGTEVEMIVEGPCKEVSKLDGEVAWVHRNEKVAVRINGGNNDVFAEVCPHALMVDGQPAFSAPLSSTWLELMGYYLNLATEMFIYAWFCFGMLVELGEMIQLRDDLEPELLQDPSHMAALFASENTDWSKCRHSTSDYLDSTTNTNSTYLLIPSDVIDSDRSWLLTLLIVKAILTAICVILAARRVHSKVAAIQDEYVHLRACGLTSTSTNDNIWHFFLQFYRCQGIPARSSDSAPTRHRNGSYHHRVFHDFDQLRVPAEPIRVLLLVRPHSSAFPTRSPRAQHQRLCHPHKLCKHAGFVGRADRQDRVQPVSRRRVLFPHLCLPDQQHGLYSTCAVAPPGDRDDGARVCHGHFVAAHLLLCAATGDPPRRAAFALD